MKEKTIYLEPPNCTLHVKVMHTTAHNHWLQKYSRKHPSEASYFGNDLVSQISYNLSTQSNDHLRWAKCSSKACNKTLNLLSTSQYSNFTILWCLYTSITLGDALVYKIPSAKWTPKKHLFCSKYTNYLHFQDIKGSMENHKYQATRKK